MSATVPNHRAFAAKLLPADGVHERRCVEVAPRVRQIVAGVCKALAASLATVRLLARVNAIVQLQASLLLKYLATHQALIQLACVQPHVVVQVTPLIECLLAFAA